jgi:hypothetical protein
MANRIKLNSRTYLDVTESLDELARKFERGRQCDECWAPENPERRCACFLAPGTGAGSWR